jgi:nitroreductase
MKSEVVRLLNARYATRAIRSEPIPEEILADLKEAARMTPSCFNKQPWRFLFLQSPEARAKAAQFLAPDNFKWAGRAPLIVVGYSREEDDCRMKDGRAYHQFDLGMSIMNMMLAATENGLVARPMAGFNPQKVSELFGLDPKDKPLVVVAIGRKSDDESHVPDYAKGADLKPRERKPADEIIKVL